MEVDDMPDELPPISSKPKRQSALARKAEAKRTGNKKQSTKSSPRTGKSSKKMPRNPYARSRSKPDSDDERSYRRHDRWEEPPSLRSHRPVEPSYSGESESDEGIALNRSPRHRVPSDTTLKRVSDLGINNLAADSDQSDDNTYSQRHVRGQIRNNEKIPRTNRYEDSEDDERRPYPSRHSSRMSNQMEVDTPPLNRRKNKLSPIRDDNRYSGVSPRQKRVSDSEDDTHYDSAPLSARLSGTRHLSDTQRHLSDTQRHLSDTQRRVSPRIEEPKLRNERHMDTAPSFRREDRLSARKETPKPREIERARSPIPSNRSPRPLARSDDDDVVGGRIGPLGAHKKQMNSKGGKRPTITKRSTLLSSLEMRPTSSLGLARNNLASDDMSQGSFRSSSVLPQITTKDAKARSYLVGSMAPGALLGAEELERYFPDRKLRVFVGTWNMMELKEIPESLDDFILPDHFDYLPDLIVVGTQESTSNRSEWEIKLQETLGPQHVLFHSAQFGVLYLCMFMRRDLIWYSSAHDGKSKERIEDYKKICRELKLPKNNVPNSYSDKANEDVTSKFDCVFWCGDLNCRMEKENRGHVTNQIDGLEAQSIVDYDDLMDSDELFRVRNEELAFTDFQEGRITFKPTYKYDVGSNTYDTTKLRIPSYTDRVLFRTKKKQQVTCLGYHSAVNMLESDHRPVFGLFDLLLRPGRDNIQLSGGQFNRQVWLEGNRRRAQRTTEESSSGKRSSICAIV